MKTRDLILTALFATLTALGAFLRIPVGASSFTLQFLFTAMAGMLLGAGRGAASQAVYVLLGLVGVPVFTTGGGLAYVLQPTFGFLLGLIPAAWVIGRLHRPDSGALRQFAVCAAGLGILYLIGLPYMHLILTGYLSRDWSVWQTIRSGMLIFLPWDALKLAAAVFLSTQLRRRLRVW